ncbi:MAG: TetR/AcrR family transcriptional regulator [Anaerolineae bacterium]
MDSKRGNHPPRQSRRERRIERRRHEIVTAAAQVFAEKGYAHTTTKDLADAADMAEGTLYNYFEGKRDILLAILNEMCIPIDTLLQQARPPRTREEFIRVVENGLEIFVSQLDFTRALLTEIWVDDVILEDFVIGRLQYIGQAIKSFVARRVKAGNFRPIDPETVTPMILGAFVALIAPVLRGKQPAPTAEERHKLAQVAVDLLFDGLRVRENG